jgi:ribosomal protein S18 acetylase RimI-like enzyme
MVGRVTDGVLVLNVRDLLPEDLVSCGWSGSALHLESVARELDRALAGEVEYLAVCPPSGVPVGIGGVDYEKRERAGYVWQLIVHPVLRSCGIGSLLVGALEARIRARGLRRAELSVEQDNPRARALYERLGYMAYASEPDGWYELGPDGTPFRYKTTCTLMRKQLGDSVPTTRR